MAKVTKQIECDINGCVRKAVRFTDAFGDETSVYAEDTARCEPHWMICVGGGSSGADRIIMPCVHFGCEADSVGTYDEGYDGHFCCGEHKHGDMIEVYRVPREPRVIKGVGRKLV